MSFSVKILFRDISSRFSIADTIAPRSSSGSLTVWSSRTSDFEAGTFQQLDPAARADRSSGQAGLELTATDLALLLTGIDVTTAQRSKRYTRAG